MSRSRRTFRGRPNQRATALRPGGCNPECLVQGAPNKVIAYQAGITEATVKVHVKAILRKIRVKNRTQAAIWAINRQASRRGSTRATAQSTLDGKVHSPSVPSEPGHDAQGPPIFQIVVLRLEAVVRGPAHARRFRREVVFVLGGTTPLVVQPLGNLASSVRGAPRCKLQVDYIRSLELIVSLWVSPPAAPPECWSACFRGSVRPNACPPAISS